MSRFLELSRLPGLGCTVAIMTTLVVGCGDRGDHQTMATKSQAAFEEAQKKGIPIGKNAHGGHNSMGGEEMSGMHGGEAAATSGGGATGAMAGMDMSGSKSGMKGMDMSGSRSTGMKGMDMSGSRSTGMKGMDMSGSRSAGMKGMDMSGSRSAGMKGMDMSGTPMSPVVPQPTALQPRAGETAATLRADPRDTPAPSSVTSAQQSVEMNREMASGNGAMAMSMGSYVQHDVGRSSSGSEQMNGNSPRQMPGMSHEQHSQSHGGPGSEPKISPAVYFCASHPEIVRDHPGKCPIDGTPLVKKEER
jgi:Heavy metal binding domain